MHRHLISAAHEAIHTPQEWYDWELGYRTGVVVAPTGYPRLVESLHFDIQSTGQKSHCVNILEDHRNALF